MIKTQRVRHANNMIINIDSQSTPPGITVLCHPFLVQPQPVLIITFSQPADKKNTPTGISTCEVFLMPTDLGGLASQLGNPINPYLAYLLGWFYFLLLPSHYPNLIITPVTNKTIPAISAPKAKTPIQLGTGSNS